MPLTQTEQDFIRQHQHDNVPQLLLRQKSTPDLDIRKLAVQISARQRVQDKLPTWVANEGVIFPTTVPLEQSSSEQTAQYKARLVAETTPHPAHLLDGTGGLGVDAWAFAGVAERVTYVERNPELAELAAHNLPLLGASNVTAMNAQTAEVLQNPPAPIDWIYLDPARRDDRGGRVARLDECEPDVVAWWPLLQEKATHLLLKTSPLIDLEATLRQLPGIRAVQVVAVRHEVKEVLLVAQREPIPSDEVMVTAVDLTGTKEITFSFRRGEERAVPVVFSDPQAYLYEPNAAVLKAGAFRVMGHRFGLAKLAAHSHLYTSNEPVANFPGRAFAVQAICKPAKSELQTLLPDLKANLTVRNFPQSVEDLRKKLSLKEGGNVYIFATTLQNGDKRLIVTSKVV
jgi:hypothetical protein